MDPEEEKWDRLTAWMEELSEGRWLRKQLKVEFRQVPGKSPKAVSKRRPFAEGGALGAGRALFATEDIAVSLLPFQSRRLYLSAA